MSAEKTPEEKIYDVVIIGAGIQGAGVAQAAATDGYKTLVIEKFSQAGLGTSCKSSKLIHGGLRYLESGQFKLVKECLRERKTLLKNAPNLVKLIPFYIPVYAHSLRPAWLIFTGLCIYFLFSLKPFSIVKKTAWSSLDGLNLKNLKIVFKYYDAQTDDKKLTQAVINSAEKLSCEIIYDADFLSSHTQNKTHLLSYIKNKKTHNIKCQCIVNCTGPWVNETQTKISPTLSTPAVDLIAGTHIIVDKELEQGIYYIEAADKRAVFVMPWKNQQTLIGTTEKKYTGDINSIAPSEEEKTYLLKTYNQYFKTQLSQKNIVTAFAGLRVLPRSENSAFNKSRESIIIKNTESPKLITLVGGKLTAYRASADEVLIEIKKAIKPSSTTKPYSTKDIPL
ncbi:Aerobic glycerol-3-phosphate dehydrogenase [hydrothermal vent metagenome]|uniref:Aerobic glycerol-3-phosphate dehydrogenase n=1 Tax=hydrothermal vent metagenome TaxID=652676 RepID=A0A3B0XQQ6_9ZZZZ